MKTIVHHSTLFYYDGPHVFEARDAIGGHYIAVVVGSELPDAAENTVRGQGDRCLVAGVAPDRLRSFRSGAIDLRSLLLESVPDEHYLAAVDSDVDQPLRLERLTIPLADSGLLPDPGFLLHDRPADDRKMPSTLVERESDRLTAVFDSLNASQRRAASWRDGPLLVLAGSNSGKTRVLAVRVARILEESDEASVLALTFTNKAAAEMRERVERLLGHRADRARLCTFHAFAGDLLSQHGSHVGLRPDFTLLTQDEDRLAILDEVVAEMPDDDGPPPLTDRKNLLGLIDRLFAESYDGGENARTLVRTPTWLPRLHAEYCKVLVAGNRLDFGSLLHFARRLLQEKPGVARVVRLGWSHVCVDEFQDTNKAQYDLLRLIAPDRQHALFVVGDDDQIIYQWNGASPERLAALRRDYDLGVVQLPECYRCPASVIAMANRLIAYNERRTPNKHPLTSADASARDDDGVVRHGSFPSPEDEAAFVARDLRDRRLDAADCVVLGRTAKLLARAAEALDDEGIPACLLRRKTDFESPLLRVFVEALRLANGRHDRGVLRRLFVAWRDLSGEALEPEAVAAEAALSGGDFLRAWADAASALASDRSGAVLDRLRTDLVDGLAFPSIVDWFLADGWESWSGAEDRRDEGELTGELDVWRGLHHDIVQERGGAVTLNAYLQQMDLASKAPVPKPGAVRCMTVHGAKGLEFRHVYLIGMAQEVFPSFLALGKGERSRELEEERRNCFVAITRVEHTLTLTRAERYYGYPKAPSQFLAEMGIDTEND